MESNAREEILGRLREAPKNQFTERPNILPLRELALGREEMVARFIEELVLQAVVVHRAEDPDGIAKILTKIAASERLKYVVVSTDDVVAAVDLHSWGKEQGIVVRVPQDFPDRDSFKDAVFREADAGITGVDYGVAESGTLGIIHDRRQPRLVSLAPAVHIAVVPVERIVPTYEKVTENVYRDEKNIPSHLTYVTGPSMTADIKATLFKGMHGPRKLFVIIVG
jgi:L-lactate dehydrogenase complex protein LldG